MVSEDQIVVASDVVQDANDFHQLALMVELTKDELKNLDEECGLVLADAGYCSEENLEYLLEPDSPNALIATRKDRKQRNDTGPPAWSHPQGFTIAGFDGSQAPNNGWSSVVRDEVLRRGTGIWPDEGMPEPETLSASRPLESEG